MIFAFTSLAASIRNFIPIEPEEFDQKTKMNKCVMVRYYSMHQEPSTRSFRDYNLVAKAFNGSSKISIAGLDCGKYRHLCVKHNVYNLPTVRMFCGETMEEYNGGFSYESLIKWGANISEETPIEPKLIVKQPNSKTFKQMLEDHACVLTSFETPWCQACIRNKPRLNRLARLFYKEPQIAIATIDVDRYRDFVHEYETLVFPDIRLFVRGEKKPSEYYGKRKIPNYVEFLNEKCGTRVQINDIEGELGLNDEGNQLAEDYFDEGRNPLFIQEMHARRGLEHYIYVMQGLQDNGDAWLDTQLADLKANVAANEGSEKDIEELKKKINVISFVKELIAFEKK
ncbi:hypothetical protein TVAG_240460 [Trichomonas vaginalis G3]|uniref:Thioredoxin domain-containing protein n=1 Tax=Trichomonas vaginalis (strain ATCC PRA-98 / G3) TaxID=412133 RepID=A2EJ93_TRIV3|nr:cell redox homeostasis [Trichomonas vaginalis G3]EAY07245.1 hypothetical protein TVAG_240460 [Trichomonas vaginalis G3]KAI5528886.1 cell redox homeostasis [Trichomonas vaginalis G3]|eukprot:XP_001319468.1 hypothetical protein [Trichomonas vaginalis G3]